MSEINLRINEIVTWTGLSLRAFCRNCGLSESTLAVQKQAPSGSTLLKILETYPELSTEWLMRGEGEMLKTAPQEINQLPVEDELVVESAALIALEDDGLTVGERLDIFIQSKGLGRYQFEMKCGLSQGYIANIRNSPHPDKLKKIANVFPELNIEWLMIGRGEMLHRNESGILKMVEAHQRIVEAKLEIEQNKRNALDDKLQEITRLLNKLTKR